MKLELKTIPDGRICLVLKAESRDEEKVLVLLDGSTASTQNASGWFLGLASKPLALAFQEDPAPPAEG